VLHELYSDDRVPKAVRRRILEHRCARLRIGIGTR
jgi:hypothetical protein